MSPDRQPVAAATTVKHLKHELRTPINQIVGFSELILEELEEAGESEDVSRFNTVCDVGKNLVRAIEALLSTSPADSVRPDTLRELQGTVQQAVDQLEQVDIGNSGLAAQSYGKNDLKRIVAATARLAEFARTGTLI